MKIAKIIFWAASVWGVLLLTPLFFIFDRIGQQDPPPVTHPGFYYGFVTTALSFQFVFMMIATDPVRFRPIMILSVVEKFSYVAAVTALHAQHRIHGADLLFAAVDFVLGFLFLV